MFRIKNLYAMFVVSVIYTNVYSQVLDTKKHVDTLTVAERFSLHVNAVDWLMLVPSIGVEYDLGKTNYNRWTVGMHLRGNMQSNHTFSPGMVYNMAGARIEARNYWRTRQVFYLDTIDSPDGKNILHEVGDKNFGKHTRFIDRVFSMRRFKVKHPLTTYYRGVYLSYNKFSMLFGKEGKQGTAMTLGFTYGIVRPLYVYSNGNSVDFELGVSAGLAYAQYDTYRHDREGNCYPVTGTKPWHIIPYPVISDLRAGFVYRFGKYPVTRKYRWKFDCDENYSRKIDNLRLEKEKQDDIDRQYMSLYSEYKHIYDSVAGVNKVVNDSLRVIGNAVRKERKERKGKMAEEQKKEKKIERNDRKAEARERKMTEREAKQREKVLLKQKQKNVKKEDNETGDER